MNQFLLPSANEVCEGYVFTRVCLSTGGCLQAHTRGGVGGSGWGVSRPIPRGRLEGLARGGLQAHTHGEVGGSGREGGFPGPGLGFPGSGPGGCPGPGSGGGGAPGPGVCVCVCVCVCIPACTWRHPPADGYCCGRYASYWNAFLFLMLFNFLLNCKMIWTGFWTSKIFFANTNEDLFVSIFPKKWTNPFNTKQYAVYFGLLHTQVITNLLECWIHEVKPHLHHGPLVFVYSWCKKPRIVKYYFSLQKKNFSCHSFK